VDCSQEPGTTMKSRAILLVAASLTFACAGEPEIAAADVERIISTLSADSMGGRDLFTPGIAMAESFIQSEFADIGLETLEGLDSYAQRFAVYSLTPERHMVALNGRTVPEDRIAASVVQETIRWDSPDDVDVVVVGPDDDPADRFFSLRRREGDFLVLVHDSHEQFFNSARSFMARPRYTPNPNGPNVVMVLTRVANVTSLAVELDYTMTRAALTNVVGVIPGRRSEEIVLFTAHHDHVGIGRPQDGDSIYNGANDDASGTTAVLTLARYFKQLRRRPERTLIFATFTAEESGGFGSWYLSRQLDADQIVAMFNIEMIGKPGVENPDLVWITGYDRSSLGEILHQAVPGDSGFGFGADPYPAENLFYRSDNAEFARLGVPAHSISTTSIDSDADYHQPSDELETLDIMHMTKTIRAIARAAMPIISGEVTPTRVDTSQVN
jgi:hypothetical protein